MRPLSPHLQIYKPELTSILSILHRITGIGFMFGIYVVLWWLHIHVMKAEDFSFFKKIFSSFFGQFFLFGVVFSVSYHFCNGIRYLFWALGFGFNLKPVYCSGYMVILFSIILSVYIWINV